MYTLLKRDRPQHHRFLLDCRPRNAGTIRNHSALPNIAEGIEFVPATPLWNKIDLTDGYYNIRIEPECEKHITFLCHIVHHRSRVMQRGDCNAPATIVRAMNEIFVDMILQQVIIYIDDMIISSRNYKQHIAGSRKVLQHLQDQEF